MERFLVTAPYTPEELDRLAEFGEVSYRPWTEKGQPHTEQELIELAVACDATAVIVEIDPVGRTLMEKSGIRTIGCCRAGLPNVDVASAKELGLAVVRTPGRNAQAVAEYVLAATISHLRNLCDSVRYIAEGEWGAGERPYIKFRGGELAGRTVVLHGFGAVARTLTPMLRAFDCEILTVDPFVASGSLPDGVRLVQLEEGYAAADVLSVHLPVTPDTTGLIDGALFGLMPPHAIFVNSARAAVVDYEALTAALKEGQIAGAILDVYREEPISQLDADLAAMPQVLATPHIAGATHEVVAHHSRMMTDALAGLLAGEDLPTAIRVA